MIGKTINQYRILEKLGSGGMGDVYKAEDTKLRRLVALKFLPLEMTRDEKARKRFIQEARAASALDHPNIGIIHEINETDGNSYIAMAYYAGETLRDMIEKGPIEVEEAIDFAIQIAKGLSKAHDHGIVHRDMKPANVVITEDGQVKIIDFGLAKMSGRTGITKTGATVGTVAYMSPEQAQHGKVDERTDIWSLGIMIYEMLAGENPFIAEYEQAVVYSILNEEPEFITKIRREIPGEIEKVLIKALAKDPKKRFESVDELLTALERTNEALREGEVKRISTFKLGRKQRKYLYRSLITTILLAAMAIYFGRNSLTAVAPVKIALLPLKSIGNDANEGWFDDSMTEALITNLAKISELRVTSQSSSILYRGTNKSPQEIASELDVEYLIEASVVKVENQFNISARLINARKDQYLWAEDYKREFMDILALQNEIAMDIAKQVKVKLSHGEQETFKQAKAVNNDAYLAYLKARHHFNQRTDQSMKNAVLEFQKAIKLDSTFAEAHAGLANVFSLMGFYLKEPPENATQNAINAANVALSLDSTLAEAHIVLNRLRPYRSKQVIENSYKRTIRLNPSNSDAYRFYAWHLMGRLKLEESRKMFRLAEKLDPLSPILKTEIGWVYLFQSDFDNAINQYNQALDLDPNFAQAYFNRGEAHYYNGDYGQAIESIGKAIELNGRVANYLGFLGASYVKSGHISKATEILDELNDRSQRGLDIALNIFVPIYMALGDKERVLDLIEEAHEKKDSWVQGIRLHPIYGSLRGEPRFEKIIASLKETE